MQQLQIFYPVSAMVLLTFGIGVGLLRQRFAAVARGEVDPRYFLLNRGGRLPRHLAQLEQHFQNLFELPVLFYLLAVATYATDTVTQLQLWLAWAFVFSRVLHSWEHVRHNRLRRRMSVFVVGAVVLMAAWAAFVYALLTDAASRA